MVELSADHFADTTPSSAKLGDEQKQLSVLIIRMGAFGDIIHTLPALEMLRTSLQKEQDEDGFQPRIDWLVKPVWASLLKGHPALNDVLCLPPAKQGGGSNRAQKRRGFLAAIRYVRSLRVRQYDLVLDLQGNTKSGLFARLIGGRRIVGFGGPESRELNRFFVRKRYTTPPEARHVVEKNAFLVAKALGVSTPNRDSLHRFNLPPMPEVDNFLTGDEAINENRRPLIALNPGAGWPAKRWPPHYFAELIVMIRKRWPEADMRLTLGPGEEALAEAIQREMYLCVAEQSNVDPTKLLGPLRVLSISELASFLRDADAYVGGDTGPTHLAAAVGTPVVALFGEWPAERNGPWPVKRGREIGKIGILEAGPIPSANSAGRKKPSRSRPRPLEGFPIEQITPLETFEALIELIDQ